MDGHRDASDKAPRPAVGCLAKCIAGGLTLLIAGLILASYLPYRTGRELPEMSLPRIDQPVSTALEAEPGDRLLFSVAYDRLEHRGFNDLRVRVELLRQDTVVASTSCVGIDPDEFEGVSLHGWQHIPYSKRDGQTFRCWLSVPDGDADALRVTPTLRNPNAPFAVSGMVLRIRAH